MTTAPAARPAEEVRPSGLVLRRASDITPRSVNWLWKGRIARGKITIIAGHPGLGKSQLALSLAATLTTGGLWPVDGTRAERGSALILSAEDDAADTIVPRLQAAGAVLNRCHIVEAVRVRGDDGREHQRAFSLQDDLRHLAAALDQLRDVELVIIDPISAYVGATDSHKNAEVRAMLAPLKELAEQHHVAVVLISHLRKSADGDAILRVTGSLGFVAAARAAFLVTRDPNQDGRRLFLPLKNNLGNDSTGYAFVVEAVNLDGGIETCKVTWDDQVVSVPADEALAPVQAKGETATTKRDTAKGFIRDLLSNGPVPVKTIEAEARAAGISAATLRRASEDLRVKTEKVNYDDGWQWSMPSDVPAGQRADL